MRTNVIQETRRAHEGYSRNASCARRLFKKRVVRTKLDIYVLLQVHDMEFAPNLDIIINETLPALQKVKDSGKAKFIGITGYPLENFRQDLKRIL